MNKLDIPFLGTFVAALAAATALDAIGQGRMFNHAAEDVIAAAVGGLQAAAWQRFVRGKARLRTSVLGVLVAGVTSFVLARSTLPWLDLGPIGAGPPGELPLLVLPFSSLLAVLAALRPRGASLRG